MSPGLNDRNVQVSNATVEIKMLTLSCKGVTQAVFRQFIEAPLIKEDGNLNGVAWGTVNYHPDKCADDAPPHWHVVWQQGGELRRSRVTVTYEPGLVFWSKALEHVCGQRPSLAGYRGSQVWREWHLQCLRGS